jgi:hypothetical protein
VPAEGGPGPGGVFYVNSNGKPFSYHWWNVDGFNDCHAEIQMVEGPVHKIALRPTEGRCADCRT